MTLAGSPLQGCGGEAATSSRSANEGAAVWRFSRLAPPILPPLCGATCSGDLLTTLLQFFSVVKSKSGFVGGFR